MSLKGLLERGIHSVLSEQEAGTELQELLHSQQLPEEAEEHIRQTVQAMPGLLVELEAILTTDTVPEDARGLFQTIVKYLLKDDDLIPSHAGKPLLGLLDDVYLLHIAALALEPHIGKVDMRSVAGGAHLLEGVLPKSVTNELKVVLRDAVGEQPG